MSIMFNEIRINEEMLPIYIYIYIGLSEQIGKHAGVFIYDPVKCEIEKIMISNTFVSLTILKNPISFYWI